MFMKIARCGVRGTLVMEERCGSIPLHRKRPSVFEAGGLAVDYTTKTTCCQVFRAKIFFNLFF